MAIKSANDGLRKRSERPARASSSGSKKRRKQSPLESGLTKITLSASSFAWAHGKRDIRGFQVMRGSLVQALFGIDSTGHMIIGYLSFLFLSTTAVDYFVFTQRCHTESRQSTSPSGQCFARRRLFRLPPPTINRHLVTKIQPFDSY